MEVAVPYSADSDICGLYRMERPAVEVDTVYRPFLQISRETFKLKRYENGKQTEFPDPEVLERISGSVEEPASFSR